MRADRRTLKTENTGRSSSSLFAFARAKWWIKLKRCFAEFAPSMNGATEKNLYGWYRNYASQFFLLKRLYLKLSVILLRKLKIYLNLFHFQVRWWNIKSNSFYVKWPYGLFKFLATWNASRAHIIELSGLATVSSAWASLAIFVACTAFLFPLSTWRGEQWPAAPPHPHGLRRFSHFHICQTPTERGGNTRGHRERDFYGYSFKIFAFWKNSDGKNWAFFVVFWRRDRNWIICRRDKSV